MSKNTNLSFLTDYITADITNGRIGINTPSPAYAFDVTGIARTSTSTYLATASGNVGIGTTTPDIFSRAYTTTLGISSSTGDTGIMVNGGTSGGAYIDLGTTGTRNMGIISTTTESQIISLSTIPLVLKTNSVERMRITSAGRVAINVTPNGIFHAKGTSGAQVIIDFEGNNENYYDANTHIFRSVTGSYPERMRITSGGNVGIGTSSPSDKLSVVGGGIYTDSNIYSTGRTKSVGGLISADGYIGVPINSWTTFYTMPGMGIYSAIIDIETFEDINTFGAYCVVFASNSHTSVPISVNGSLVQIRVSGMNIQCLLTPGLGYARTMYYKILRT